MPASTAGTAGIDSGARCRRGPAPHGSRRTETPPRRCCQSIIITSLLVFAMKKETSIHIHTPYLMTT